MYVVEGNDGSALSPCAHWAGGSFNNHQGLGRYAVHPRALSKGRRQGASFAAQARHPPMPTALRFESGPTEHESLAAASLTPPNEEPRQSLVLNSQDSMQL